MSSVFIGETETKEEVKTFNFTYVSDESCEAFLRFVRSKAKVSVMEFRTPNGLRSNAFSLAFRDGDGYVILIDANASRCKFRFGLVKELFHIYFGLFLPVYTVEKVEEAIRGASIFVRRFDFDREFSQEDFCYACALEFFVPRLNGVRAAAIDLKSFPHTDYVIAQALRIPLSAASYLFDGNPSYIAASNQIHESLENSSE